MGDDSPETAEGRTAPGVTRMLRSSEDVLTVVAGALKMGFPTVVVRKAPKGAGWMVEVVTE